MSGMRWQGLVTVLGVTAALVVGTCVRGATPPDAKYLGSKLCTACHKGTDAEMVEGWVASDHSRAMWKIGEADDSHQVVADFAKNAPFTRDRAVYVLGGRREQAFLDADLKVLPGRWVVKDKTWAPQEAVDAKCDCLGCHTTGYDAETGTWKELGVGCEMCHGPGSAHAGSGDEKATIMDVAQLDAAHQAMVCGRCHSRGKSKDGKYAFAAGFRPGDDLDQSFTLTADVPKGAMNAEYNELRLGGGKHLASGAVCTTCHDPHGAQPRQLREAGNQLCLKCHAGKLTGAQHSEGALRALTCTKCHMPGGKHVFAPPPK